jgi:acyl carrier protein
MADDLNLALKELMIKTFDLRDVQPEDIGDDEPLFGSGLELDSLDGLELVLQLEKTYAIKIGSSEASREALQSVNVLAEFIRGELAGKI